MLIHNGNRIEGPNCDVKPRAVHQRHAYLTILNSRTFSDLMHGLARQKAGGQWDLSRRYIELVPLPEVEDLRPEQVELLPQFSEGGGI